MRVVGWVLGAILLTGCGLIQWETNAPPIDPLAQLVAAGDFDGVAWSYYVSVNGGSVCEEIRVDDGAPGGADCISGSPADPLALTQLIQPGCVSGSDQPTFGHGRVREEVARVRVLSGSGTFEADSVPAPDATYQSRFFIVPMPVGSRCGTFIALDASGNELGRVGG